MILTEDQVRSLAKPIFDQLKKLPRDKEYSNLKKKLKACPDYYPTYKLCVEYAERIKVHSQIGDFPEHLFIEHSPNQTEKEYEYMKANFKQSTLPVFVDYDAANKRCFNDGNWNIYYHPDEEEFINAGKTYQDYLEKHIKDFGSLEDYVKFYLATQKSVDANGVIAVKPTEIHTIEDESGEVYVDNSQLLEPQPFFYPSNQVLSDSKYDSKYIIVESHEKSEVDYYGKNQYMGYVLEVYDSENIWRVYQTGKFIDFTFDVEIYFTHGEGVIPACRLQGIPHMVNESIVWQSPFLYACDLLDLALMNKNYLQCSIATVMFPYRIALGDACEFKFTNNDESETVTVCEGGQVRDVVRGNYRECPSCHGSGLKSRFSQVGGTMILKAKSTMSDGDSTFSGKALEFVSPETTASEFVNKIIEQDTDKAYDVIHIKRNSAQSSGTGVAGDGTATSSILDLKTMYASIKIFSDQIFGKYEFIANRIGWQRYGEMFNPPVISYPVSFDFNTEEDYLKQISAAYEAHLPTPVIIEIIMKYLRALYYNEKQSQRVLDLIIASDRLFVLSQDEALAKQRVGLADKWEVILHDSSFQFIDELIDEYASTEVCADDDCSRGFFALNFDEQKDLLIEKAKNKANSINVTAVTNGLLPAGAAPVVGDELGKIPLALQQMTNAVVDAEAIGNKKLSKAIQDKALQITGQIES